MCTIQRCAEISLTKACMVCFPMWAKYKICKATTAWHGMIVLIDKLVICQTNFIEVYLVKNTWTSRNQNSLKSSCFHQSFIRRLTDLPNPDLAYLLVRCWNLFTEVPGCFLWDVPFFFRSPPVDEQIPTTSLFCRNPLIFLSVPLKTDSY